MRHPTEGGSTVDSATPRCAVCFGVAGQLGRLVDMNDLPFVEASMEEGKRSTISNITLRRALSATQPVALLGTLQGCIPNRLLVASKLPPITSAPP